MFQALKHTTHSKGRREGRGEEGGRERGERGERVRVVHPGGTPWASGLPGSGEAACLELCESETFLLTLDQFTELHRTVTEQFMSRYQLEPQRHHIFILEESVLCLLMLFFGSCLVLLIDVIN